MKRVRVLIADDNAMLRNLFSEVLREDGTIEVVGEAVNSEAAMQLAAQLEPDVVMMDYRMPDLDGLQALQRIQASRPSVRGILMTGVDDPMIASEARRVGAFGFLLKRGPLDILPEAVHTVAAGKTWPG